MTTTPAETVGSTLSVIRTEAPSVGLAALQGKTPNKALRAAWSELDAIGVKLERSNMQYYWRALHDVNPKLGHAIEEVLVFGDALHNVCASRQSPEGLKDEYMGLKQRFSKILKEVELAAAPKEEKKLFSFFGSPQAENGKTDQRLSQLDTLIEEAYGSSRVLLGKAEKDVVIERAFHRATEWYILALQDASKSLAEVMEKNMVSSELVVDLQSALAVSSGTSSAILATTEQWLRVKEMLHNKSITFLTAHENTFTIIQGHLSSWKDIKTQTEALNALNKAVQMGTALMSEASTGIEKPMSQWTQDVITPEALQKLSSSFTEYDKEVNSLVMDLVTPKEQKGPQLSRWDNWNETKRDLLEPILNQPQETIPVKERLRPVLKKAQDASTTSVNEEELATVKDVEEDNKLPQVELPKIPLKEQKPRLIRQNEGSTVEQWNRIESKMAFRNINVYRAMTGSTFDLVRAQQLGWSAQDVAANLLAPVRELGDEIASLPASVRSEIDYLTQSAQTQLVDWKKVATQKVIPFDDNWPNNFRSWMKEQDDLDWSYLMQWNELVYDLLILDQDSEQKQSLKTDEGKPMREDLISRIEEFLTEPHLSKDMLKTWGFSGLIARYAMSFDIDPEKINNVWGCFSNPVQPVDWDGSSVSTWIQRYPEDCQTDAAKKVLNKIDPNFTTVSHEDFNKTHLNDIVVKTLSSQTLKNQRGENDNPPSPPPAPKTRKVRM